MRPPPPLPWHSHQAFSKHHLAGMMSLLARHICFLHITADRRKWAEREREKKGGGNGGEGRWLLSICPMRSQHLTNLMQPFKRRAHLLTPCWVCSQWNRSMQMSYRSLEWDRWPLIKCARGEDLLSELSESSWLYGLEIKRIVIGGKNGLTIYKKKKCQFQNVLSDNRQSNACDAHVMNPSGVLQ